MSGFNAKLRKFLNLRTFFMRFLLMSNNLQWFLDSPFPKGFSLTHTNVQPQQYPDFSQINVVAASPSPFAHHPLSPFTPVGGQDNRGEQNSQFQNGQYDRPEINSIVQFSQREDEQEMQTPEQKDQRVNEEIMTTGRKSSADRTLIGRKSRPKEKGLKGLSTKAYNAVVQMKQGTYKQVAQVLLKQLNMHDEAQKNNNEQTNIKRRVYDALNVLIALGLLRKQGRKIVSQRQPNLTNNYCEKQKLYQILKEKQEIKEMILCQKRKKLEQAKQKLRGTQGLIEKNKLNYEQVKKSNIYIPFPYVGVITNNSEWKIDYLEIEEVQMLFSQMVRPFGDMDSLRWL